MYTISMLVLFNANTFPKGTGSITWAARIERSLRSRKKTTRVYVHFNKMQSTQKGLVTFIFYLKITNKH